jgi:hypothetical protein
MGLTIHHEMRIAGAEDGLRVDSVLNSLRQRALDLSFDLVTPLIEAADHDRTNALEFFAEGVAALKKTKSLSCDVERARCFLINPGAECEILTFGFLPRSSGQGHHDWVWWSACKTQYATLISEDHFFRCHARIVELLDHAATLDVELCVTDEGDYWETRDKAKLIANVRRSNHVMASLAGALTDALGQEAIQAPILAHPQFERIEMGLTDDTV